jgi:tetrathionate reductase subunit B
MGQKALVIDVTKCTACFNCFMACKDEFAGQPWPPYSEAQPDNGQAWIFVGEIERGQYPRVKSTFIPQPCMLCEDPTCVRAAKNGAAYKREDGIVVLDPVKSKGQKQIVKACRYGRIFWNEELQIPQKCDYCVHLLEKGWKEPRCVEVCPARVFSFGEKEELKDLIAQAQVLHPEYRTSPAVYYIGLPGTFLSGSIFSADTRDCLEGIEVKLTDQKTGKSLKTTTNNYGDFDFDGLETGSKFIITIEAAGYLKMTLDDISIQKDLHLGNIYLTRKKRFENEYH